MAGTFTKRIWQPYICQPNELREIKKKSGGDMAHPSPPLESPLLSGSSIFTFSLPGVVRLTLRTVRTPDPRQLRHWVGAKRPLHFTKF